MSQWGSSSADVVGRCLEGDVHAWEDLVRRYAPYVLAILRRQYRLGDQDAEDVLQDVLLRTYERLEVLQDPAAFQHWLARATRNAAIDHLRRLKARPTTELQAELADNEDWAAQLVTAIDVRTALGAVREPYAEVLDRFFCRDEDYATIAAETGLSQGTIASRISRGIAQLRTHLSGELSGKISPAATV